MHLTTRFYGNAGLEGRAVTIQGAVLTQGSTVHSAECTVFSWVLVATRRSVFRFRLCCKNEQQSIYRNKEKDQWKTNYKYIGMGGQVYISWGVNCDSTTAQLIGGAGRMALLIEDCKPRTAWIDNLSSEKDNLHRSQHMVGPYAWFHNSRLKGKQDVCTWRWQFVQVLLCMTTLLEQRRHAQRSIFSAHIYSTPFFRVLVLAVTCWEVVVTIWWCNRVEYSAVKKTFFISPSPKAIHHHIQTCPNLQVGWGTR